MIKFFKALVFLCLLHVISAQQRFHKAGENYDATVVIQRPRPYPNHGSMRLGHQTQPRPFHQGNRITKEEVAQNLARELLNRRRPSAERYEEQRLSNERKLEEYTQQQVQIARQKRLEWERMEERRTQQRPHNYYQG